MRNDLLGGSRLKTIR